MAGTADHNVPGAEHATYDDRQCRSIKVLARHAGGNGFAGDVPVHELMEGAHHEEAQQEHVSIAGTAASQILVVLEDVPAWLQRLPERAHVGLTLAELRSHGGLSDMAGVAASRNLIVIQGRPADFLCRSASKHICHKGWLQVQFSDCPQGNLET